MPSGNKSKKKNKLFTTLASIEQTDKQASQRRRQTITNSYAQSLAASNQCKINSILLELRILTQRCLSEAEGLAVHDINDDNDNNSDGSGGNVEEGRVQEEVDALMENLLVARRELIGKDQLNDDRSGKSNDNIDYAKLIQQQNAKSDVIDVSSSSSSSDGNNDDDESSHNTNSGGIKSNLLTTQIQNEYSSLRKQWKTILNKHHSNLALHSGMSVNTSKFQSKAVDISFWEQVQGGIEHELFKQRTTANSYCSGSSGQTLNDSDEENDEDDKVGQSLQYDDSKLYQQMLKDFISSSATTTGGGGDSSSRSNKRGLSIDPATEAAQRLKRVMRKKTGNADVDLTSLLTNDNTVSTALDGTQVMMMMKKNKKSNTNTVDRRASKGRKIRYTVNPKLVNFTFPIERAEPMIDNDVWFKSLFGGVGKLRK